MKNFLYAVILMTIVLSTLSYSQQKTIDRKYIPIIISGQQSPLVGLKYADSTGTSQRDRDMPYLWHAYKYNSTTNEWTAVPFQIDELDSTGTKYNKGEQIDGLIDSNSELLVMPEDLGDRAPVSKWVAASPVDENRIELEYVDPLDSSKKGWIYLYHHVNPVPDVKKYLYYGKAPAKNPAADTVKSNSYTIGHNKDSWINYMSFSLNPKINLIDRLKMRLFAKGTFPFGDQEINEDAYTAQLDGEGPVTFRKRDIRSFQDERGDIKIMSIKNDAFYFIHYFPYSVYVGVIGYKVDSVGLFKLIKLKTMRQSLDLSNAGIGMKFYSEANPGGSVVDGIADSPVISLDQNSLQYWFMASGEQGTILIFINNPRIINSTAQLYFRDNKNGQTNDGTADTGDLKSYGDMGLWIDASSENAIPSSLTLRFTAYFIDVPNLDTSFGSQMLNWDTHPLTMTAAQQSFSTSTVEQSPLRPENFYLYPAYPNPYKQGEGTIRFEFQTKSANQKVECTIYNLLGQQVMQYEKISTGHDRDSLSWDGRDKLGRVVAPGIFLYRVQAGSEGMTRSLVMIH
jgi:hypothetical protein